LGFWVRPTKKFAGPHLNQWLSKWCIPVIAAMWGSTRRRIAVQSGLNVSETISKITNTKRAGSDSSGRAQGPEFKPQSFNVLINH
jgi:hypothetical protein